MDNKDIVLSIKNAGLKIEDTMIFSGISLEIRAGEIVLLAGRSGVGKSSLMNVINGYYPRENVYVTCDKLEVSGQNLLGKSHLERTVYVRTIFQNARLSFAMATLYEEMVFRLENFRFPTDKMEEKIISQAKKYEITSILHREFALLSGGELQRAAFACADLVEAPLYLMDEPFANIDEESIPYFMNRIKLLAKEGRGICIIDHRLEFWHQADRWYILDSDGNLHVSGLPIGNKTKQILINEGLSGDLPKKSPHKRGEKVLIAKDVSVISPEGQCIVEGINFELHAGEMLALVGRSGIGKTSIFKAILKQFQYGGDIEIFRQPLKRVKKKDLYSKVGIVFQDPSLQFVSPKVMDEIKISFPDLSEEEAKELLEKYNLHRTKDISPWLISQGQQRRLAFVTMTGPGKSILLVDEPTYGQDFKNALEIMKSLEKLCAQGTACIFTSHDKRFVKGFAHNILEIKDRENRDYE